MKFIKLVDAAIIPIRGTTNSAGYDLFALLGYKLYAGQRMLMSTGIAWEDVPDNWVGIIKPRSSLAHKHGIDVLGGVIDSDYRHEIRVILINHGDDPVVLLAGSKIAQLVISEFQTIGDLVNDSRDGGFGSTDP